MASFGWKDVLDPAITVIGGILGSQANKKATKRESEGNAAALEQQERQYQQSREDLAPWRETGNRARDTLERLVMSQGEGGMSPEQTHAFIAGTPGYEFARGELEQATGRRQKAMGLTGGAALLDQQRELERRLTGPYYDRTVNNLGRLAGYGTSAVNQGINLGQNNSNQISNLLRMEALNQANSATNSGKIWDNTIRGVGDDLMKNTFIERYLKSLGGGAA